MPLYEFRCEDCGKLFEKLVSQADTPVSCINCQSMQVKKQFSVFVTKGSDIREVDTPPGPCNSCDMSGRGVCGFNQ